MSLLRSDALAALLGISPRTLNDWRHERSPQGQKLRACIWRQTKSTTWWSTIELRRAGLIADEAPAAAPATTAAGFTATARWGTP